MTGAPAIDRRALLRAGAAAAAGVLVAPGPGLAAGGGDVALLREAVRLEQRLALAFAAAVAPRRLAREWRSFAAHARNRGETLGASLRLRGGHQPPPQARGPRATPRDLLALEEQTVAFYVRALGELRDTHLILFMGSALTGHAQELVVLRQAVGRAPLGPAFEAGSANGSFH